MPDIPKTNLTKWFKKENQEESTWFQESKKECCPSLPRYQRIFLFGICFGMGILCFSLSLMYIPFLLLKARKFALLFTLGSLFFVLSFFFLWGPLAFVKHMLMKERLLLTVTYGGTLGATLYCALHLQSTPFTVLFAVCQLISLLWTVIANIPGGATGLSFFSKIFTRSMTSSLPV